MSIRCPWHSLVLVAGLGMSLGCDHWHYVITNQPLEAPLSPACMEAALKEDGAFTFAKRSGDRDLWYYNYLRSSTEQTGVNVSLRSSPAPGLHLSTLFGDMSRLPPVAAVLVTEEAHQRLLKLVLGKCAVAKAPWSGETCHPEGAQGGYRLSKGLFMLGH